MNLIARLASRTIRRQAEMMRRYKGVAEFRLLTSDTLRQTNRGLREEIAKKDARIAALKEEKAMLAQRVAELTYQRRQTTSDRLGTEAGHADEHLGGGR